MLFDSSSCSKTAQVRKAANEFLANRARTSCRNGAEILLTIQKVSSFQRNN